MTALSIPSLHYSPVLLVLLPFLDLRPQQRLTHLISKQSQCEAQAVCRCAAAISVLMSWNPRHHLTWAITCEGKSLWYGIEYKCAHMQIAKKGLQLRMSLNFLQSTSQVILFSNLKGKIWNFLFSKHWGFTIFAILTY